MSMIVVNVGKVIDASLREGETREKIVNKLYATARDWILRDFSWYKQHNEVQDDLSFNEFQLKLKADALFKLAHQPKYVNCLRKHFAGYLGEIAVHYLLGEDWRLVFKFNDVNVREHQADGYFGGMPQISYNVKTRLKNEWGLTAGTRYRLQEGFYVLAHYRAGFIRLVGYASRDELERHPRSKFGNYDMPREELHPIEYFTRSRVFDGLKAWCGRRWNDVSKLLP